MRKPSKAWIGTAGTALVLALLGCRQTPAPEVADESEHPPSGKIVLGDVASDIGHKSRKWQPLADYLAAGLGDHGIGVGELRVVPDLDTMAGLLRDGEVDLYMDSFYPVHYLHVHSGAELLLLRRKTGAATYRCVIFARADSGLTSLANLAGQTIAVEERASTSGYLLPLAHLIHSGLRPVEAPNAAAPLAADEVRITFSGDDDNTIQWVSSGRVTAGAVDQTTYDKFARENPGTLVALGTTSEIIRHQMILARPGMSSELRAAVKAQLFALSETVEGRAFLEQLETVAFSEILEQDHSAFRKARRMFDLIEGR